MELMAHTQTSLDSLEQLIWRPSLDTESKHAKDLYHFILDNQI